MLAIVFIPIAYWLGIAALALLASASACKCAPDPADGKKPKDAGDDAGGDHYDSGDGADAGPFRCNGDSFECDGGKPPVRDAGDGGDAGRDASTDASEPDGSDGSVNPPIDGSTDGGTSVDDAGDAGPDGDGGVPRDDAGPVPDGGGHPVRDGGGPDGGGPDGGGNDGGPIQIPGANLNAWNFSSPIAKMSAIDGGALVFEGGNVWHCAINGLDAAACVKAAAITECIDPPLQAINLSARGLEPVDYIQTPSGFGLALFADPAKGTPNALVRLFENTSDPSHAVETCDYIKDLCVSGLCITPMVPGGIAATEVGGPPDGPYPRFFVSFMNDDVTNGSEHFGTVASWSERYSILMFSEFIGVTDGLGASSIAETYLNIGGTDKSALAVLNSKFGDKSVYNYQTRQYEMRHFPSSISLLDPEHAELRAHKPPVPLGDVRVAHASQGLLLDQAGHTAYVVTTSPQKEMLKVSLETENVSRVALGNNLIGDSAEVALNGDETIAYIADKGRRLISINNSAGQVSGFLDVPIVPKQPIVSGAYLLIAHNDQNGGHLAVFEPTQIEWR